MAASVSRLAIKPRVAGEVGLPKPEVPTLRLTHQGAEGDYNHYRATELHGDPDQAVLVVTEDLLSMLAREGWPVQPGDLGENLTLRGVSESALSAGVTLQIGAVSVMLTKPCDPCANLYVLPYVGKEKGAAFLRATVGKRGWYGKVMTPGPIRTGAPVTVRSGPQP